jgi:probable rRNA maturation factor
MVTRVITVDVANTQTALAVDPRRLRDAVRMILQDAGIVQAQISVAVVDDRTISQLHQNYLHDSDPTDVLSFVLESAEGFLEGEVIVSAETAAAMAPRFGWPAADELLLYVIHGTLHLIGYDDTAAEQAAQMRAREQTYLARFGLEGRYEAQTDKGTKGVLAGGRKTS